MVKMTQAMHIENAKEERLSLTLEENVETINSLFKFPIGVTELDLNKAIIMGDQVEIDRINVLLNECKIKCDRICKLLGEALDAEARDVIMCKITMDLDAEF